MKKRITAIILSAIMLFPAMAGEVKAAGTAQIREGVYEIVSMIDQNYCLDVSNASKADRANMQLWTRNGSGAQRFEIVKANASGYYFIRNANSGKVIDAQMGGKESGTNLWQWRQNGSAAQLYRFLRVGDGVYEIQNVGSGHFIDASQGIAAKGTNVQLWRQNHSPAQRWRLNLRGSLPNTQPSGQGGGSAPSPSGHSVQPVGTEALLKEGVYEIVSALDQSLCLDISNGSTQNGGNAQLWTRNGSSAQKFYLHRKNGVYYLSNQNSGKYLDAANGGMTKGTNLWQWQSNGSAAQQVRIYNVGNGQYEIRSVGSGLYYDVSQGIAKKGQNVQLWLGNHTQAQRWLLKTDLETQRINTVYAKTAAYVAKVTSPGMTKAQKLRICFDSFSRFTEKNPWIPDYKGMDWPQKYADYLFDTNIGNCLSYAAGFAYMAKVIGYEDVYACSSGGHGWAQINGLVYDPEWTLHNPGNYYGIPYRTGASPDYKGAISAGLPWMKIKV